MTAIEELVNSSPQSALPCGHRAVIISQGPESHNSQPVPRASQTGSGGPPGTDSVVCPQNIYGYFYFLRGDSSN